MVTLMGHAASGRNAGFGRHTLGNWIANGTLGNRNKTSPQSSNLFSLVDYIFESWRGKVDRINM